MNAPFRPAPMALADDRLAQAVDSFLYALDRGDFGQGHRFSDGSESAYVADLRTKLIEHRTIAGLARRATPGATP